MAARCRTRPAIQAHPIGLLTVFGVGSFRPENLKGSRHSDLGSHSAGVIRLKYWKGNQLET